MVVIKEVAVNFRFFADRISPNLRPLQVLLWLKNLIINLKQVIFLKSLDFLSSCYGYKGWFVVRFWFYNWFCRISMHSVSLLGFPLCLWFYNSWFLNLQFWTCYSWLFSNDFSWVVDAKFFVWINSPLRVIISIWVFLKISTIWEFLNPESFQLVWICFVIPPILLSLACTLLPLILLVRQITVLCRSFGF